MLPPKRTRAFPIEWHTTCRERVSWSSTRLATEQGTRDEEVGISDHQGYRDRIGCCGEDREGGVGLRDPQGLPEDRGGFRGQTPCGQQHRGGLHRGTAVRILCCTI